MCLIRNDRKLVRPGQWVLAKLPEWSRKRYRELKDRDKAWICIVPHLWPRYDCKNHFEWHYSVFFRWFRDEPLVWDGCEHFTHEAQLWENEGTSETGHESGGCYTNVSTYSLDLISMIHDWRSRVQYDPKEYDLDRQGKCAFLYEPASDDPEACPGGDYSLYQCNKCNKCNNWVAPWSNDAGELLCPNCDQLTGIYCDVETAEQMERARALASYVGKEARRNLDQIFTWMARESDNTDERCNPRRLRLYREDSFSFGFSLQYFVKGEWKNGMTGGIICHGPHAEIQPDGTYLFRTWDYSQKCSRAATPEEINSINWSTHT